MITTKDSTHHVLDGVYKDLNLTPGGIYVGRDGSELSEMRFDFSEKVKDLLSRHLAKETLNSFDVNLCLEGLSEAVASEKQERVAIALQGVREIFDHLYDALCKEPDHPRLFRFGEVFQSKQSMSLVLSVAMKEGTQTESGASLVTNLRQAYDWSSGYQPPKLTDEQVGKWFAGLNHTNTEAELEGSPTSSETSKKKPIWKPPLISRAQVELAFNWVEECALTSKDPQVVSEAMAFLCHAVQQVSSRLAMMTGDGYEAIPGTKLFSDPEKEKAISRVEIEHALLTSTPSELLETAKVAALMIAIGGSALTGEQIAVACGQDPSKRYVDANTYGMTLERQMQTGLRVLRLIHQLSAADSDLADVLQLYGKERLSIPEGYAGLGESSARVWELRNLLDLQVWESRPEAYRELQSHLVQLVSNGRASLGPSNSIQWDDVPR